VTRETGEREYLAPDEAVNRVAEAVKALN